MKEKHAASFEVEMILLGLSASLRRGRLLRGETQELAAQRANTSIATYARMESRDTEILASISIGTFFDALCMVGYRDALFAIYDVQNDAEGALCLEQKMPKRGEKMYRRSSI